MIRPDSRISRTTPLLDARERRGRMQNGFTLVELMLAMTISLVLLLLIGTVFVSSRQAFRVQEDGARIQESGRFALEILGRSIKQAGFADIPFIGDKMAFSGTAINGTNGAGGAADTLTVQYDGIIGSRDCEGTVVIAAGTIIQNHFNLDAANAELQCAGTIAVTPPAPGPSSSGQVLLNNVEDLQVLYGIDTTGDQSANQYVAVPANWDQVVTARICILIRSEKMGVVAAGYYLGCNSTAVAVPADRRLRQAFSATYNLRNRVNTIP
ncbi:type IV pilus assembly protein PilW [Nitrosomonas cryotolerans]|uniref:Type IV pilus assembly protein PilW n=2 Tax=Nitrosomonas cryotolerans TaxID=44575 RepID=A0A1N6FJY9_9PROT|nr:type IV pilus assembly protein PilW [Nitrosomonas cryotolerans]SIN95564.1 type IV pilus assembly protein PilW [Nitrosomonas cryotolerans ATCC 49181]